MATKFSNFNTVGTPSSATIIVGLDGGLNSQFTIGTINLDQLNGVLPVSKGGTGVGSLTAERILVGDGTNAVASLDATVTGNIITGYQHPITGVQASTTLLVGNNREVLTADSNDPKGIAWTNVVEGNPGGTPALTLSTIKIHGADYTIDSGTVVVANPGGNPPTDLQTITIGATDYTIPTSSGGGDTIQTLTGNGATVEWDFTLGNNAIWEPVDTGSGNTPQILVESATASKQFPDGARGCLKIIPTNTTNFQLFSNSKLPSNEATINAQIASANPSIIYYFYDGTNFNWFYDVNMVDPIYSANATPDPSVNTTNLVGFWWPGKVSTLTNGANVPNFTQWDDDPGVSSPLVGNLRSIDGGTGSGNHLEWYARDEAAQEAPYWKAAPAGTSAVAGFEEQQTFTNTTLTSWSATVTFQVGSGNPSGASSYQGILDLDQNDDVAWYMYDRQMIIYEASTPLPSVNYIQGGFDVNTGTQDPDKGFPKFVPAGATGNPNAFDLEDTWVFVHIAVSYAANLVTTYIGCQATWDNRGGTILSQDGTVNLPITASGLYVSANAVPGLSTLGGETVDTIDVWRAAGSSSSYAWEDGRLGLCALWDTSNIQATTIEANWANIRQSYYIT